MIFCKTAATSEITSLLLRAQTWEVSAKCCPTQSQFILIAVIMWSDLLEKEILRHVSLRCQLQAAHFILIRTIHSLYGAWLLFPFFLDIYLINEKSLSCLMDFSTIKYFFFIWNWYRKEMSKISLLLQLHNY